MSDFDRNVAARGGFADRAAAVDAGLRAYMLRVYNYMAAAVALTGVVAYATFNAAVVTDASGKITALTSFGQTIFSGPLTIVLLLGTLGLVFFISFRINRLQYTTALALFMVYAGAARRHAVVDLPGLHRGIDHAGVLHLGGVVRRAEPVRLHHPARPVGDGLVPDHGPVRHHHREPGQHLPQVERARLGDLGDRRRRVRRPHRLRHPEDQGDV